MPAKRRSSTRRRKKISRQGVAGQKGINQIENVVLEMGCHWTPSGPNESGIDGYLELFDPNSQLSLGITLAVQSKVVTNVSTTVGKTFNYWCKPEDLEYWLQSNLPVILVVSTGRAGELYWVSIKGWFKNWKPNDSTSVTFDKRTQKFSPESFSKLCEVAGPTTGMKLAPLRRDEQIFSNLLSLHSTPPKIYSAQSPFRGPYELREALGSSAKESDSGWVLWEKKIITFHDLHSSPWSATCDPGTIEEFDTEEWSHSDNPDIRRIFVRLLNQTLKSQLYPDVRFWPHEECYAIAGPPRKISYTSLKKRSALTVVSQNQTISKKGGRFVWLRHLAFKGQFRLVDPGWCLEITPTYRFTNDGFTLDRFHEERLKTIKEFEGNRAVLSSVLFWEYYLTSRAELFRAAPPLVFGSLLNFTASVGIDDATWQAKSPSAADKQIESESLFAASGELP